MAYSFYPIFIIFAFFLIIISKKYNFFLDKKKDNHKKIFNPNQNYFLGGIFLFFFILTLLINDGDYVKLAFLSLIFLIGLLSDFKILNDPKKRFILQGLIIIFFAEMQDIKIISTRFDLLDLYLQNNFINYVFVVFCLMVLINGSNFIDGLNSLLITYKIIVLLTLIIFLQNNIILDYYNYELLFALLFIFLLNSLGLLILGDSGAYLLSLIFGLNLIDFSNQNNFISPFFIVLLLWYPCFELLYSIIRRLISDKKSYEADINHLHQLLYLKFFNKNKLNFKINHLLTSLSINLYNFLTFCIGINFIYQTKILIFIIIINISVYLITYNFVKKKVKK